MGRCSTHTYNDVPLCAHYTLLPDIFAKTFISVVSNEWIYALLAMVEHSTITALTHTALFCIPSRV